MSSCWPLEAEACDGAALRGAATASWWNPHPARATWDATTKARDGRDVRDGSPLAADARDGTERGALAERDHARDQWVGRDATRRDRAA